MFGTYAQIKAVEESSYGITPASALQSINVSGIKMPQNRKRGKPDVLTGDRRRYPSRILQKSGEGLSLPMPWQYQNDLLFLEGLLGNTRGSLVTVTGSTIGFTTGSPDKIEDSADGYASILTGDMIFVTGAGAGANADKWFGPVTKTDAGELTVPAGQIVNQAAGGSVTIRTRRLIDGTTLKSYSIEYQLTKLTTMFRNAVGQRVKSGKFSWKQGEFVTAEYMLSGKTPNKAAATIGTGADTAAPTTGFLNAVDDLRQIFIGGYGTTLNAMTMSSWEMNIENMLELIYGLGNVGPSKVDVGAFDATLDVSILMEDAVKDLLDAQQTDETLYAFWNQTDPQGNHLCWCLPALRVDVDDVPVDKADSLVNVNAKFYAHDPAKDADSPLGQAIPYQAGLFFCPL
ncbi:MAG: phage tail tube protein [Thermoanaerobaculia bacterium]